jgi:hypothetical protein
VPALTRQTNVSLDPNALSSIGLFVGGFSPEVIIPGALGSGSVAFPISPRTGNQPTSFFYEPGFFAPFGGSIEHTGLIFFNLMEGQFAVGNLSIGYDESRAVGAKSGFFVESTFESFYSVAEILFDIETPSSLTAQEDSLSIVADLLVSPELAQLLYDPIEVGAVDPLGSSLRLVEAALAHAPGPRTLADVVAMLAGEHDSGDRREQ